MIHRRLALLITFGAVAAVLPPASGSLAGQTPTAKSPVPQNPKTWTLPRTADGQPDLQGIWNGAISTPMERPGVASDRVDGLFLEDDRQNKEGTNIQPYNSWWSDPGKKLDRPQMIIDPADGTIPALTPEAQKREAARIAVRRQRGDADSYLDRNRWERCLSRGLPMLNTGYNPNYQILQAPGYIVIVMEMIHDTRVIPLDGRPHSSANLRSWLGDSRGRWEGDTLVVDTVNFNDKLDGGEIMPSHHGAMFVHRGSGETMHLTERFTRIDANTINYEFTIDDPKTYTRPWTAGLHLTKGEEQIFEYACHEGNYGMVQMLKGARAKEAGSRR